MVSNNKVQKKDINYSPYFTILYNDLILKSLISIENKKQEITINPKLIIQL